VLTSTPVPFSASRHVGIADFNFRFSISEIVAARQQSSVFPPTAARRPCAFEFRAQIFGSMSKLTDTTTMTAEASTTKGRPAPAFRKPNQTRAARQRQELIAAYIQALGGADRVSPIVMQNITRAAELAMLANTARADLAAGKTTIGDVVLLEGASDRAIRRLGIKPGAVANAIVPLRERLRGGAG
jgi:hypothetical protein